MKGNYFFDRSPRERHGARALARFGINNKLDITLYKDEKKNGRDGKKKKKKNDEEEAACSLYLHKIITESDLLGARPDSSTSIVPFGPYVANAIHT